MPGELTSSRKLPSIGSLASSHSDSRREMVSQSDEVELAGVGPLGHHLQRRVGGAADHRHAHEIVAEALHLGLDPLGETRNVGHLNSVELKRLSDRSRGPQPQASGDVEERAAI